MQIVRVYSGDDGESHFEDLTADQLAEIVYPVGSGAITLGRRSSPSFSDYHTAPRRQYTITLSGEIEIGTGDGTVRRFGPGSVLLAEDLTGQGHTTRVVSQEPRVYIVVPLGD